MSNPEKGQDGGKKDKGGVDLDNILENEVGQFGRYQLITLALASLPIMFSALATGEYIFTTARIPTRCLVPQCDVATPEFTPSWLLNAIPGTSLTSFDNCEKFVANSSLLVQPGTCPAGLFNREQTRECESHVYENQYSVVYECDVATPEFTPSWLLNAIPGTSLTSFDNCEKFVANSSLLVQPGTCPAGLFNREQTRECESHVYENQYSVVYEFDLACDEWRRSLIGTIRTVGTLVVLPLTGYISDRWGRRVALIINTFNTGWVGLVRSFVNSYEWFLALEILESSIGAGAFSSCYILVMEFVGPKYRVIAGAAISSLFALGQVLLGLIAWGVPSWRPLTRIIFAPQLLVICYFWILSESVRWLLIKGRYEESEIILLKVAKVNKKELSQESLQALKDTAEATKLIEKPKEPWLIVLVFRSKIILSRCLVSPIWWITSTLVYYGMGINAVNLSGNSYLNYMAVAAIDIPGYWTAIFLLDRVGRKPVLITAYWLCAACQFVFAFLPEGNPGLSLFIYLFGKYCIAIVMMSMYVYTAELYPTKYRHNLFAFSSMIGRLGSITAPLTPALAQEVWEPFPSVLFGSFALLSGLLVFTTPETLGSKLPNTFEEAEQLGKKTSTKTFAK